MLARRRYCFNCQPRIGAAQSAAAAREVGVLAIAAPSFAVWFVCCVCCCRHMGEVVETQPTIGSNVEEVVHNNVHFNAWDLGGQESLRQSWQTYFLGTHAVIIVVDSTDRARIDLVKLELDKLLHNAVSHARRERMRTGAESDSSAPP